MSETSSTNDPYAPKPLASDEDHRATLVNLARWLVQGGHDVVGVSEAHVIVDFDKGWGVRVRVRVEGLGMAMAYLPRGQRFGPDEVWPWAWEVP